MAKIMFAQIEGTVTGKVQFSRNPSYGNYSRKMQFLQPKEFTAGGDLYCYDHGIGAKKYITLQWRNIPKSNLDTFINFLEKIVKGSRYSFLFFNFDFVGNYCGDGNYSGDGSYCYASGVYNARIMNTEDIRSAPVAYERESLTVELLIE